MNFHWHEIQERERSDVILFRLLTVNFDYRKKFIVVFIDKIGQIVYVYISEENTRMEINMGGSLLTLNDLPDEILLLILKQLDNIEVLYLFIGLNKRFTKLVHDSIFTNHLTMIRCSSNGSFDRLDEQILAQFCSQILPSIHHNIKWLDVECSSMKDVLFCTSYPNISGLGLHNIEKNIALRIFTGE
jgi:hypothetical protein